MTLAVCWLGTHDARAVAHRTTVVVDVLAPSHDLTQDHLVSCSAVITLYQ